MIGKILSLFDSIRLNLTEWVAVSIAVVIGGLVTALKVQGSRLHKAQVQLLDVNITSKIERAHEDTESARDKYTSVLMDYLKAGGTLMLLIALSLGAPARGDAGSPALLPKCQSALSACVVLVKAQDAENAVLRDSVTQWKKMAEAETSPSLLQTIPWPVWVVVGGLVGFGVGRLAR